MPFNGSGTFTRLFNWTADAGNNLPISATKFDGEDNDFASGFGNCLTRDGQGAPTSPLTWTQPLTINVAADGTDLAVGRTGGANNPQLQVKLADATGATLNLSSAQQLALAINGTNAISISGNRNVTVGAPVSGGHTINVADASGLFISTANTNPYLRFGNSTDTNGFIVYSGSSMVLQTVNVTRLTVSGTNVVAAVPVSIAPGGTAQGLAIDSTAANGAYATFTRSGTALADFGNSAQVFAGGTLDNFGLGARPAHGLDLGAGGAVRIAVSSAGNVTINSVAAAPSLTLAEVTGTITTMVLGAGGGFATAIKLLGASAAQGKNWMIGNQNNVSNAIEFTPSTANGGSTFTTPAMSITGAGNVAMTATAGTALTINGVANSVQESISDGTVVFQVQTAGGNTSYAGTQSNHTHILMSNNIGALQVSTSQEIGIVTPATIGNLSGGYTQAGYMDTPQHNITTNTTLALSDRGKSVYMTGSTAAQTLTIPANASVAFPVGTTIIVVNNSSQSWSVAITTDTLDWLPSFTAGARTLASRGVMTLYKDTATTWLTWGFGIT